MRATLIDVAREAGVSPATVDRALNNRAGVRSRTRDIVFETAERLGYIPEGSAGSAVEVIRLDFLLPAGTNSFIRTLRAQIEAQAALRRDLDVRIADIEGFNPESLGRHLTGLQGLTRGVGVVALDHPAVREAIRGLSAGGASVVTIASDILHVPRAAYIGIDNRAAGRLAGYLVRRFLHRRDGKVALFAGSLSYRGHEEREMGFRHILVEESPGLQIVELREVHDDRETAWREALALLDRHPDLAAIYNVGGGTSGIARALNDRGRQHDVVFVAHEATDDSKRYLLDGTIDALIDQNPRVEAREALNILAQSVRGLPVDPHPPRLQVIFKENIPEI